MTIKTYDQILQGMLDRVPATMDKREGSVIYDDLAPAARELADEYAELAQARADTFAGTAQREWLIKRGAEIGISPYEATYAIRRGQFTPASLEIAIGERFSLEDVNFVVTEKVENGLYNLRCETAGEIGNFNSGRLIPINYIQGLETAQMLEEVVVYGEEEEDTEDFRQRYFDTLPTMTLDGNIAQYEKWCREYAGIGNYKIFPTWNGKGTVKVSILSSENTVASKELIDGFQEFLDPGSEGVGEGKAPIGATVTVTTATEVAINVKATLVLRAGFEQPVGLEEEITEYLHTLNYSRTIVSYTAIAGIIAGNETVDLALDVSVNGKKENVTLGDEEIAKLGTTEWVAE